MFEKHKGYCLCLLPGCKDGHWDWSPRPGVCHEPSPADVSGAAWRGPACHETCDKSHVTRAVSGQSLVTRYRACGPGSGPGDTDVTLTCPSRVLCHAGLTRCDRRAPQRWRLSQKCHSDSPWSRSDTRSARCWGSCSRRGWPSPDTRSWGRARLSWTLSRTRGWTSGAAQCWGLRDTPPLPSLRRCCCCCVVVAAVSGPVARSCGCCCCCLCCCCCTRSCSRWGPGPLARAGSSRCLSPRLSPSWRTPGHDPPGLRTSRNPCPGPGQPSPAASTPRPRPEQEK